ncbi:MAG: metal-dependent hydrolase [Novosphingobium sp.]
MPTIITHAVVPLTVAAMAGRRRIGPAVAVAGALLAMVPDADVIGFRLGIAYADDWGHRGATHSLVIALLLAGLVAAIVPAARSRMAVAFLFCAAASHGLLDMLTDGGLGVALFWPVDTARHFFPWTPIRVSPIGTGFFSLRGVETILSEMALVWLPCAAGIGLTWLARRRR